MKEIKILIRNLREYPDNFFVYPVDNDAPNIHVDEAEPIEIKKLVRSGLVVCDMNGVQQGFIETGGKEGVIIK